MEISQYQCSGEKGSGVKNGSVCTLITSVPCVQSKSRVHRRGHELSEALLLLCALLFHV